MWDILRSWLHLVAMATWIGPQVFLFVAVAPALRKLVDPQVRRRATEVLTARYNLLAWGSLAILVITGILNTLGRLPTWEAFFTTAYGRALLIKHVFIVGIVLLTSIHGFVIGPRILAFTPASPAQEPQTLKRLYRLSAILSAVNLLLALLVVLMVTIMRRQSLAP